MFCDPVHMRRAEDVVVRRSFTTEGSILPAIFDFLYREYCRARLVEMRKQLFLIQTNSPESPEADGNVRSSDGLGDSQREDDQARPKWNGPREPPPAA
jgi:hypothetical protein